MIINRKELMTALTNVSPGLPEKEILSQTGAFMFRDNKVYAFNDRIAVSCPVSIKENFTIKSDEILSLLSNISDRNIEMKILDRRLIFLGRRKEAGLAINDFSIPIIEIKNKWRSLPLNFIDGLQIALRVVNSATCSSNFWTTCLHIYDHKIEACDNYRAICYTMDKKIKGNIVIPAIFLSNIISYRFIKYSIDTHWIHFLSDLNVVYSCRLVDNIFQDLSSILKVSGRKIDFPKKIEKTLNRAVLFSDDQEKNMIKVSLRENNILVSAKKNMGWYKERVKISYSGPSMAFIVNAWYLKDILDRFQDVFLDDKAMIIYFTGENFTYSCKIDCEK